MGRTLFSVGHNVEYQHRDSEGNLKSLFSLNKFGLFLMRLMRKFITSPFNVNGKVKDGFLNHLAVYGLRVNFLTGMWRNTLKIHNLITNAGMAGIASRLNGSGAEAAFTYIATGTGTTAAAVTDTTLETELSTLGLSRAAATASRVTTDVTDDSARLVKLFSVTGTGAVTESGVLNAASVGVLLARQVFSAINVENGDSLQITWTFDID